MIQLILPIGLLIIFAWGLLCLPFYKKGWSTHLSPFTLLSSTLVFGSISLYLFLSQPQAVKHWLQTGHKHYVLMTEVEALGGITGLITRLENKLSIYPDDPKGWSILGKLYYANQQYDKAEAAFQKARRFSQ